MLNQLSVIGRIVAKPELKTTKTGKKNVNFTVAVNRDGKDAGTDFINVVAWEKTAELCANYLDKGRLAYLQGRLQLRDYKPDWSEKNIKIAELVLDKVNFIDSNNK
jgi:single-strand DNA-binding protein